jgi:hypothetical protein
VTIFGNVNTEHLAYGAWSSGNFPYIAYSSRYFTMTVLSASRVTVFVTVPCPLTGTILTS